MATQPKGLISFSHSFRNWKPLRSDSKRTSFPGPLSFILRPWAEIFSWLFFRREKYDFLFQLDGFLWFLCIFQIFNVQKWIPKKIQPRIHSSHILKISEISTSKCIVVRYTCSHYDSLLGKSNYDEAGMMCGALNWAVYLPNYLCLFAKRRNCLWEKQIKNKIKEKRLQERWLGFFYGKQYHPALPSLKNIATRRWELIQNQSHLKEIITDAPPIISES